MLYRFALTLTKKQALLLFLELCLPSSSFRPWVPDLNLNKSLEPMSETLCKYFLHSKSSINSLYTLNLLFSHIPECKLLITKFLNALFVLDTASLEPSEVEVTCRSISLIISKTHFFHCFLFLPGILHLFHSFSKTFLQKLSLPFFNNLENQTTFFLFLLKFKGSIPKSPHIASLQVFEEQPKIFFHAANNTALDWDVVNLHTSLPYSNDD